MANLTVFQRGKTWTWRLEWKEDGKRKTVSKGGFARKYQAKEAGEKAKSEREQWKTTNPTKMYLHEYAKQWKKLYKDGTISPRTEKGIDRIIRGIEEDYRILLTDVTKENFQEYLNELAEDLARPTVKKHYQFIKKVLDEAVYQKTITTDPTHGIVVKGNDKNVFTEDSKFFTEEEFRLLAESLKDGLKREYSSRYLLLLAMYSGARVGELLGLTWDCVDFDNNTIHINKSYDYNVTHEIKVPKTPNAIRTIPIPPEMMELLKERLPFKTSDEDFVFERISHSALRKVFKRRLKHIGIDRRVRIHSLRHTHASLLIMGGMPLPAVSKRMGHADVQTTLKYYAHVIDRMENPGVEQVNAILKSSF